MKFDLFNTHTELGRLYMSAIVATAIVIVLSRVILTDAMTYVGLIMLSTCVSIPILRVIMVVVGNAYIRRKAINAQPFGARTSALLAEFEKNGGRNHPCRPVSADAYRAEVEDALQRVHDEHIRVLIKGIRDVSVVIAEAGSVPDIRDHVITRDVMGRYLLEWFPSDPRVIQLTRDNEPLACLVRREFVRDQGTGQYIRKVAQSA